VKKSIRSTKIRILVYVVAVVVLFVFMGWHLRTIVFYQTLSPETFSTFQQWKDASLFFTIASIPFSVFIVLIGLGGIKLLRLQREEFSLIIASFNVGKEKAEERAKKQK